MIEEVGRLGRETLVILRIRRDHHLDRFLPQLLGDLGHPNVEELRGRSGKSALLIRATPADRAKGLLEQIAGSGQVSVRDGLFSVTIDPGQTAAINRRLVTDGVDVTELRVSEQSLEDVFLELTETGGHQG